MLTALLLTIGSATAVVFTVLVVVVIGIKQEPPTEELTSQPPNAITEWVRCLLGVYVRKPDQPPANDDRKEPCSIAWEAPCWPEGPTE